MRVSEFVPSGIGPYLDTVRSASLEGPVTILPGGRAVHVPPDGEVLDRRRVEGEVRTRGLEWIMC